MADESFRYNSMVEDSSPRSSSGEVEDTAGNNSMVSQGTPTSPTCPIRDKVHGHDQNKPNLNRDIMIGFETFAPVAELIRILKLNKWQNKKKMMKNKNVKFMIDFVKFRDLMAHKGLGTVPFPYHQMVCSFVMYCRKLVKYEPISHERKSTETLLEKLEFARMADINVVVNAAWFLHLWTIGKLEIDSVKRELEKTVKDSSFSNFKFEVNTDTNDICVVEHGGDKDEERTEKNNLKQWVDKYMTEVMSYRVTYSKDEEAEFVKFYESIIETLYV